MKEKITFSEQEKIIGYINSTTGSLLITDGIWDSDKIHKEDKQFIDLNEEKQLKIPIITILQNNRRFILLDIDAATEIPDINDHVTIEGINQ